MLKFDNPGWKQAAGTQDAKRRRRMTSRLLPTAIVAGQDNRRYAMGRVSYRFDGGEYIEMCVELQSVVVETIPIVQECQCIVEFGVDQVELYISQPVDGGL